MKKAMNVFRMMFLVVTFTLLAVTMVSAAAPIVGAGTANVDGNPGEWNLTDDFFANMYKAANPNKETLAKLYLRYDCNTQTLYALVLVEPGHTIAANVGPGEHYLKLGTSILVKESDGDDGTPPDFAWINKRTGSLGVDIADGWEASVSLTTGNYSNFNAHTNVDWNGTAWDTAAVENRSMAMYIVCTPTAVTLSSFHAQPDASDTPWATWVGAVGLIVAGWGAFLSRSARRDKAHFVKENMMNNQAPKQLQPSEPNVPKQAYECPAIIHRAPLETTAGFCTTKSDPSCLSPQTS